MIHKSVLNIMASVSESAHQNLQVRLNDSNLSDYGSRLNWLLKLSLDVQNVRINQSLYEANLNSSQTYILTGILLR